MALNWHDDMNRMSLARRSDDERRLVSQFQSDRRVVPITGADAYPAGVAQPVPSEHDVKERTCDSCGRRMTWRRAWAAAWPDVRWCSDACRRRKVKPVDRELEDAILTLLSARSAQATICPSEAARVVGGEQWRALMEPARCAARRLVARGDVDIVQGGRVVDPSTARGPIRIRRRRTSP